ncbi:signal peptidase I [Pacificispira sp.]|uniref:signal peptidase I n=1 Tax=Pacificispira sp. TaxID=2888761 RepID=UPI003B51C098
MSNKTSQDSESEMPSGIVPRLKKYLKHPYAASFLDTAQTVFWAAVIAVGCRVFAYEPFNIPSGSMLPTLKIGDYLFVSKFSYGYGQYSFPFSPVSYSGRILGSLPERGDVAVFRNPSDPETDFIKRVVGLPGDTIQLRHGILHINGEPVTRRPVGDYRSEPSENMSPWVKQYIETLPNGSEHPILEENGDTGPMDNTGEFVVPSGHFFMMGDNRDNSSDSRVLQNVGFVPIENFIGEATIIFFSVGDPGIRFERFFNVVE